MDQSRGGKPLDFSEIETFSIRQEMRARPTNPPRQASVPDIQQPLSRFYDTLPESGVAADLIDIAEHMVVAAANNRQVIWLVGPQIISLGLAPLIVRLIEQRVITCLALDGQAAIMDFETACFGTTSQALKNGSSQEPPHGISQETGEWINELIIDGARRGFGVGSILGRGITGRRAPREKDSLLATAATCRIPITVHMAPGTDLINLHPGADGAALGKSTMRDFQVLAGLLRELDQGGVVVSCGGSALMPNILMQALQGVSGLNHRMGQYVFARLESAPSNQKVTATLAQNTRNSGGKAYDLNTPLELLIPLLFGATQRLLR